MAYKTCEDCGCRLYGYGYGCVNYNEQDYNEQDYIDMQGAYEDEVKVISSNPPVISSVCQHPLKYKVANDVRWFCPDGCGYLNEQTDS